MAVLLKTLEEKLIPEYVGKGKFIESLTENQIYALEKKYLLRDENGNIIETPAEAIYRIAKTMAEVERNYGASEEDVKNFTREFYEIIAEGYFSPAGRVWTNAGTDIKGLFNCYVLPIVDSMDLEDDGNIFMSVAKAAIIHKNGGGTGYNFSELRPRGSYVKKSKGIASGPVSFIEQFDKETEIINSGNRRGANMGILDVTHPNILDFIYAKSVKGKLSNFNVSVGVTDNFMRAVENDDFYTLEFPQGRPFKYKTLEEIIRNIEENKMGGSEVGSQPEPSSLKIDYSEGKIVIPGKTKIIDSYSQMVAGRIDEEGNVQLSAKYVMDLIAKLAWKTGDPGMIFLDTINRDNPLPKKGPIKATNPCGEQPLHPYDACNLGSIILSNMIKEENGVRVIDWEKLERTVIIATRFMDNVNDANKGPIPEVEKTVLRHRRIGLGVMGWADMLAEMGIPYDSEKARNLAKRVMGFITDTAKKAPVELAKEKGVFPDFEDSIYNDGNPENRVRNLQRTTIAPTGTISMLYNVSSGIEPFFSIIYRKNIRGGDSLIYILPSFVREVKRRGLNLERIIKLIEANNGSIQGIDEIPKDMQEIFKTSFDLSYEAHVLMQAAFQEKTDNAVSKTINMRYDSTVEDVKKAYFLAWKTGCKGITVYRDGSKEVQVLEKGLRKKISRKDIASLVMEQIERPRPENVRGITEKIDTPFGNGFITFNFEEEGGNRYPYEVFINLGKAGGDITAIAEGKGRLISMLLKAGVLPQYIIEQLEDIGGATQKGIGPYKVKSLPDAIAKGIKKILEKFEKGNDLQQNKKILNENPVKEKINGDFCPDCGNALFFEESCYKCYHCGFSKC